MEVIKDDVAGKQSPKSAVPDEAEGAPKELKAFEVEVKAVLHTQVREGPSTEYAVLAEVKCGEKHWINPGGGIKAYVPIVGELFNGVMGWLYIGMVVPTGQYREAVPPVRSDEA